MDLCETSPGYVRAIAPYQPGKPISELAREYRLDESKIVKLASNENPLGPSPLGRAAAERELAEAARYPDGNAFDLKAALSKAYRIAPEAIVVGNGSNDILELVASAFLAPGRAAVISQHAFAVYPLATQARGARIITVPAHRFGHDLEAMAAAVTAETRVVFIANPNNPTGTFVSGEALQRFLQRVPQDVVVVLDEAYNEYLPTAMRYDSTGWLARHANLVLVRTFSKIYGLAGLRIGFGLMHAGIADLLNRVRQPFNANSVALAAAAAALQDAAFVKRSFELNRDGMAQLERGFRRLGLEFIPSCANFISVLVPSRDGRPDAARVYEQLLRRSVIVRPLGGYEMPDHLRATVGLQAENELFLAALESSLQA